MKIKKDFSGLLLLLLITNFLFTSCKNSNEREPPVNQVKKRTEHTLAILPFSGVDTSLLKKIRTGLQTKLNVKITQLSFTALPASAFYEPRQRYIADSLLDFLRQTNHGQFEKIIGITVKDISTRKEPHENWGILGLGSCPGEACVISSFRAGKNKVPAKDFERRMITLALHEIGHTYGLEHCPDFNCLMKDAQGKMNLDDSGSYCENCRTYLRSKNILPASTPPEK